MSLLWTMLGLTALLLFFCAVTLFALAIRFRRGRALFSAAALLVLSYIVLQCAIARMQQNASTPGQAAFVACFTAGNGLFPLALCLGMAAGVCLLWRGFRRGDADRITPSSIKEATDTLPSGLCFCREDGRVLLVNRAMEALCRRLTGEALVNGRLFFEALSGGALPEGCQRAGSPGEPLILLPDGAAWSFSRRRLQDGQLCVDLLVAADVTELYNKTRALSRAREEVTALNRRLTDYNREIVALTTAREILNAKVMIHNELGGNLLAIRRWLLEGGAEQDRADIVERLRTNVAFLKSGRGPEARDECALMLARHILAVAIHECFTNTLRHAHGSALALRVSEDDHRICARFTNDGEQPSGPIRERGGLSSLRTLVERAGGCMLAQATPAFSITLELPKEDEHGLPGNDRG